MNRDQTAEEFNERFFTEKKSPKPPKKSEKVKQIMMDILWSLIFNVVHIIRLIVDKLVDISLEYYWGSNYLNCPPITKDKAFLMDSAVELARKIKNQQLTSYQVVSAFIDRMNQVNPVLNAVIHGPFMEALDEAKAIDERISKGEIGDAEFEEKQFLGVPFTTKDSNAVKDKLHTMGLVSRRNVIAKDDAEIVKLMKDAGAIIIATSSIPEWNKWQETRNNLIGQTNNPYDSRRTVGGSSGGEGALLAACATPIGLGSDIGGSIRMPAFYCGVYGHKPSTKSINTRGCSMRTGKEQLTMVVAGPMTRYASDLRPLMNLLIDPAKRDCLKLNEKVDVKKLKYFFMNENGDIKCSPVSGDLQGAMKKILRYFHDLTGVAPSPVKFPGPSCSCKMWRYWMTQEPANFSLLLGGGSPINPFIELGKKIVGRSDFTLAAILSLFDDILPAEDADKIKEITRQCDEALKEILGDDGVLFYHSTTHAAPFHYSAFIKIYNFSYWSLFNVLHMPVTQIPLGLNNDGLPLGLQIVAPRFKDRYCLAVAEEIEKNLIGYVPPFIVKD